MIERISSKTFDTFEEAILWTLEDAYRFGCASNNDIKLVETILKRVRGKKKVDLSKHQSFIEARELFYKRQSKRRSIYEDA